MDRNSPKLWMGIEVVFVAILIWCAYFLEQHAEGVGIALGESYVAIVLVLCLIAWQLTQEGKALWGRKP